MGVELRNSQKRVAVDRRRLERAARKLLKGIGRPRAWLSILLVDDRQMAWIHGQWMGEVEPTDVLSFSQMEWTRGGPRCRRKQASDGAPPELLGDVVISVETAARRRPGNPMGEIIRYLVHGFLHLIGYDHVRRRDRVRMERKARELTGLIADE
ncbi:MAG: rRNA maturation RNase YbeY [Candidatus Omnitrophica bacterium]|nr:rRNA maturation RNase YbeY [Candidatus Omnitrophota bacterium]